MDLEVFTKDSYQMVAIKMLDNSTGEGHGSIVEVT